ncbi:MAG: hypothetical protein M3R59_08250 [Verrucomicrobiota bacterium]|nr:hypothetical protein [Verrucomicrobiota bacterium]
MNEAVFTTIALTGFTVAFFHAAIPTHWLPFIATGRVQGWSNVKTLAVTVFAGTGHVLATAVLGLLLTLFGTVVQVSIGRWFPIFAGSFVICLGLFYLWRQGTGHAHSHTHFFSRHAHEHSDAHEHEHTPLKTRKRLREIAADTAQEDKLKRALKTLRGPSISDQRTSDRIAIMSLFALLTLSPCEGFLPIYLNSIRFGWSGFVLLTLILSVGTVAGMFLFTSLTLAGLKKVRLGWFERHESGVMGALLALIGLLIIFYEV